MSQSDVPQLFTAQVGDAYARQNFAKITEFFKVISLFSNFKLTTVTLTSPVTGMQLAHGLGFVPKDIIVSSLTGSGVVTFDQAKSDVQNLYLTATGAISSDNPTTVRILVGSCN